MPWGDGTGPAGFGPMTGRAAGYCGGYPVPGYLNPGPGFGGAYMHPFTRGWGYGFPGRVGYGLGYWPRLGGRGFRRFARPFGSGFWGGMGGRGRRGRW